MDAFPSELADAGAPAGPPPVGVEAFLAAAGPLLDVRSPAEFAQGHIPGSTNLPLFDDAERAEIGTLFKQQGRQAAVLRGLALVGPRLEALAAALSAAAAGMPAPRLSAAGVIPSPPVAGSGSAGVEPHGLESVGGSACGADPPLLRKPGGTFPARQHLRIHCWRGGMRSGSVAWLAGQLDLPVLLLEGGYKAYRHWVLERFERPWPLRLLGGRTGSGKTDLLLALRERGVAVLDLEGRAHHRGSSFGALGLPPQPSSEHYENLLAADLTSLEGAGEIWLEAESSQVGRCRIPVGLWRQMKEAAALQVERPLEWRVEQLVEVYGCQDPTDLAEATQRIAKRLGPQRTALALEAIAAADWASACRQMLDYYDRCYDHDLSSHAVQAVDLGELEIHAAARLLLERGLVRARPSGSAQPHESERGS